MSVRRLAEASVQPASFAFNKANTAWVKQTIKKYPKGREQSAVIPLLMRAQEQDGWVTKSAIEHVADMLEMPYIRVLEVATFYTQFQLKPVGTKAHVQVCGTTPCMLRGSEALMDVCRSKIHPEQFHTNEDGTLSWEEVECLGACVNAPMVMIFKDAYEDLTPERLAEVIDEFEAGRGASVPTGPQNGRTFSAPLSGLTALKDETAVLKTTRDKQAKAAAKTAKADAATVAPTQAAKPKTDAIETSPAIKSPSKVKVSPAAEKAASAEAPKEDKRAADKAEPSVEKTDKPRTHPDKKAEPAQAFKAPETRKAKAAEVEVKQPSLEDRNRPAGVEKPAQPDDLKLISGVGPKLEGVLNGLGIYTYAQVASWKKAERDWVDGYLKFKGRIERDDWVKQAKALAKGGEAEYIRVFGKKPR
ncbi:NADH-quinone oxidoreductase subunit E [Mesorhizobium microcysteis]|uniref:NADH-quinone oxidoreductase subunit E n=1 Tax=Neoaquamicrobium microcysteis TaxID=2682781 RepID=A0A5D4H2C2_9HYPH|nr:NADH-quinone oxidoreductase subunit E [Mesorhizobium microcysteis]TYR35181.1 NADH-quinone oxidoreductase subunit E [Mesorhizobium microcysteis]